MLRHPIYIPSRGRPLTCTTPALLDLEGIPYTVMVEPQEHGAYAARFGADRVAALGDSGRGIAFARCEAKRLSRARGESWHWQIDDDVKYFCERAARGPTKRVSAAAALGHCEDLSARHANLGAVGLASVQWPSDVPFIVNTQVYSHALFRNDVELWWRPHCVDDTDFSLQMLASGFCTIVVKRYRAATASTDTMAGGNTDGDVAREGRMRRIRQLQANWPGLGIGITRNVAGVPMARVAHVWRRFRKALVAAEGVGDGR